MIKRIDANIRLEARRVESGKDRLGAGKLVLKSSRQGVFVEPLEVMLPGGIIRFGLRAQAGPKAWRGKLWANVHNFNYGVMLRRFKPESKAKGIVNLNLDLEGSSPTLRSFLAHANGKFDRHRGQGTGAARFQDRHRASEAYAPAQDRALFHFQRWSGGQRPL